MRFMDDMRSAGVDFSPSANYCRPDAQATRRLTGFVTLKEFRP